MEPMKKIEIKTSQKEANFFGFRKCSEYRRPACSKHEYAAQSLNQQLSVKIGAMLTLKQVSAWKTASTNT